jgi:mRNA-degrading endonuclease RelE of RelBE toxin-antitoxin system
VTLETRIAKLEDPRQIGSALSGLWRWRIGDYRVVTRIEDERVTILVVRVGHRRITKAKVVERLGGSSIFVSKHFCGREA